MLSTWKLVPQPIKHAFVPKQAISIPLFNNTAAEKAILIPTYGPSQQTVELVTFILHNNPDILVVVVDDSTPETHPGHTYINLIKLMEVEYHNLVYLRTTKNSLKAGALNFGLDYLLRQSVVPEIIFTCDDDVEIQFDTLANMIEDLDKQPELGALCTQALVKNRTQNLLTRLQSLEYHSFNVTKIADSGYIMGPLVMQGMLTAFRISAIKDVNGYTLNHLIEDYDITARLKKAGWRVGISQQAFALTTVPHTFESLWRQRARWSYGGLKVAGDFWRTPFAIMQDLIGHIIFISLVGLIVLSFSTPSSGDHNQPLILALLAMSLLNFMINISFSLWTLKAYPNRDKLDIALKLAIIPEFIYSNIMTLILLGSYLFFIYNTIFSAISLIPKSMLWLLRQMQSFGSIGFNLFGFSSSWGTK